jgi:hypothetical protein
MSTMNITASETLDAAAVDEQARRGFAAALAVGARLDLRVEVDLLAVELALLRLVLAAQGLEAAADAADQVGVARAHFIDPFPVAGRTFHFIEVAPAVPP